MYKISIINAKGFRANMQPNTMFLLLTMKMI